jgi:hypothetical protein
MIASEDILDEAKRITSGDRNNAYGPPTQDFSRTAAVLSALFADRLTGPLEAHDVAVIMAALKLSRIQWSPRKRDHWVDLAGYARCGWQCVEAKLDTDES